MKRCFTPFRLIGVILLAALASGLNAQIKPDLVKVIQSYQHWLAYEPEAAIDEAVKLIKENPADPSALRLLAATSWANDAVAPSSARKIGDALLELCENGKNLAVFGINARQFAAYAATSAGNDGDFATEHAIRAQLLGFRQWLVCGPFAATYEGDQHYVTHAPELLVSRTREMSGEFGAISWLEWKGEGPFDDGVDLADVTRRNGNGVFQWTEINNTGATREVLLDFSVTSGGVKAWLDGEMVFNRRPFADRSRDDVAKLTLTAGKHSLVLKLGTAPEVQVAVVDAATRLPLAGITAELPSAEAKSFALHGDLPAAADLYRPQIAPFHAWLDANPDHPLRHEVELELAFLYLKDGEPEISEDYWHECAAWRAEQGARSKLFDYFYYDSWAVLATAGERAKKRREALEWLIANAKGEVMASLEMAKLHGQEGREREAADAFENLLKRHDHWSLRWRFAEFMDGKGWSAEARDQRLRAAETVAAAEAETPRPIWEFLMGEALKSNDLSAADGLLGQARKLFGARYSLVRSYQYFLARTRGLKQNEAIARADLADRERQDGYQSDGYFSRLGDLEEALGNLDAAEAAFVKATEGYFRWELRHIEALAEFQMRHNHLEKAKAAFARFYDLVPDDGDARKYHELFSGEISREHSEWNTEVDHAMLDWLKPEDFPKASAGYVLDEEVWYIAKDGSQNTFAQKVLKILRQDGVDRFGRQSPSGLVTRVRTILGAGGEAEPSTVRGNSFEFPLVAPGNALHWITRTESRASEHKVLENVNFYFAERDLAIPTALARLVIVIDAETPLLYRENNMQGVTFEEKQDSQGRRVLIWELRKPRSIENEAFMPAREEILPFLEFTRAENTWDDVLHAVRSQAEIVRPTWLVYQTAKQILSDAGLSEIIVTASLGEDDATAQARRDAEVNAQRLKQAKALYDWVNQTIKVDSGPDEPHLIITQKAGDRQALYRALLIAAAIPFNDVYAANRPTDIRDSRFFEATASFRSHLFEFAGEDFFYVSLSNRQAPFGFVSDWFANAHAARLDQDGERVTALVLPKSLAQRLIDHTSYSFNIGEDLSATVSGEIVEYESGWTRREAERESSENERKRSLVGALTVELAGINVDKSSSSDLEALGTPYVRTFTGTLEGVATKLGENGLKITPHLANSAERYSSAIETEKREFDLVLTGENREEIELRYRVPDGYTLDALPEDVVLLAAPFSYWLTYRIDGDWVVVKRHFEISQRRIALANYPSFKTQIKAIGDAERKTLTFTKLAD